MNLYYCPVCPMTCPAWLTAWQRQKHMISAHPAECPLIAGSGLPEWHANHPVGVSL